MARKRNKAKKHEDLQPWLDYFQMFREYVNTGMLQMVVKEHACFITNVALHAMSKGKDPVTQMHDGSIEDTARRLLAYAGWLSAEGKDYMNQPFAVNVVQHDEPHDPLYTLLISHPRRLWTRKEKIEVVVYKDKDKA